MIGKPICCESQSKLVYAFLYCVLDPIENRKRESGFPFLVVYFFIIFIKYVFMNSTRKKETLQNIHPYEWSWMTAGPAKEDDSMNRIGRPSDGESIQNDQSLQRLDYHQG